MSQKTLVLKEQLAGCRDKVKLAYTDNSFDAVEVSREMHFVDLDSLFVEVNRILVAGGKFKFRFPHLSSREAFEIWNGHFFSEKWFQENLAFNRHFRIQKIDRQPNPIAKELPLWLKIFPKPVLGKFLMNIYSSVSVTAENIKQ
ncbi:MAG: hypothetical protein JST80_08600 [Bdellovibrionales bacterium]|nr:hypothetical protein [Bdellovibrionales bacterium]